jgi:23S rRNA (uracil1939-C5)-methyltransferase
MTAHDEWLKVESLDLEAQGVAHNSEGKVVFIEGALPGEEVRVSVFRKKNNWEQATLQAMRRESSQRVTPQCRHFGTCGGCKMQHLHIDAQVASKQRAVEDALWHLGKVKPERVLRPVAGPAWGYRYRARLSVRYVVKKGAVLVGFHERKSSYVADMDSCEVLPPHLSAMLVPLRSDRPGAAPPGAAERPRPGFAARFRPGAPGAMVAAGQGARHGQASR